MASRMIGRATCPECGFESAHVKESDKCLYRYCPNCGSQHYAKTPEQRANLTAKTRINGPTVPATVTTGSATPIGSEKVEPDAVSVAPVATTSDTATAIVSVPRRRGFFT